MDPELLIDLPPSLGMVVEAQRGSLPFSLIHGEPLVRCAAIALEETGVEALDPDTVWDYVVERAEYDVEALALHDSLCPLTSPAFLAACLRRAVAYDRPVVAYRPVTDTIKHVQHGYLTDTLDRSSLRALASPIVLPASVIASFEQRPPQDFVVLVEHLARHFEVEWMQAPAEGRRVSSTEDVRLLAALTGVAAEPR